MSVKKKAYTSEESESLPVHVARCSERYKTLFRRLGRIEKILLGVAASVIIGMGGIIWRMFELAWKMNSN